MGGYIMDDRWIDGCMDDRWWPSRTNISFRRRSFPSSTSPPWKAEPSRSSSPPLSSPHLVKSKNIEKLNLISQPGMFTPIILLFQQSELERISLGGATTIQVAYIINLIWAEKSTFLLEENWNHFHTRPTLDSPGSVGLSLLEWWDLQSYCNYNCFHNHFHASGDAL